MGHYEVHATVNYVYSRFHSLKGESTGLYYSGESQAMAMSALMQAIAENAEDKEVLTGQPCRMNRQHPDRILSKFLSAEIKWVEDED